TFLTVLVAGAMTTTATAATAAPATPNTVVLDGNQLARNRIALLAGDRPLRASLTNLLAQADVALTKGPWAVTDKTQVPPSGNKHDYLSLAPYFWPTQPQTPGNPLGCPYVEKDGIRNPATDAIPDKAARLTPCT